MIRSDEEIITVVRAGRIHSFAELIDRYKDRGFALALRMLRNRRDAEEALQDAFVKAYQGLATFRGDASFGTWFYRILYNGCLSRLRRVRADEEPEAAEESGLPGEGPSPAEGAEHNDLVRHVTAAIDRLPPGYALVLSLFYLQELSIDEICGVTELPPANVKVRLHRARRLLTRQLQAEQIYDEVTV